MDRYIFREKRIDKEHHEGNQMVAFAANPVPGAVGSNIAGPSNVMYSGNYNPQAMHHYIQHSPHFGPNTVHQPNVAPIRHNFNNVMPAIDPHYLSFYSESSAQLGFGQQIRRNAIPTPSETFGSGYQSRVTGPERLDSKNYVVQRSPYASSMPRAVEKKKREFVNDRKPAKNDASPKKSSEVELSKIEEQCQVKSRSEKLRELHKIGTRVFSGPVEKVLKWNKSIQDTGAVVLFEIVGKCVNIRPGDGCSKNLVVRDENGPAMQVVYYEIDFLLPEMTVPCMIRVIGRMMRGSSRFQAFSIRPATGDDISTQPRRAAVSAHHVTKLCKEYGQ